MIRHSNAISAQKQGNIESEMKLNEEIEGEKKGAEDLRLRLRNSSVIHKEDKENKVEEETLLAREMREALAHRSERVASLLRNETKEKEEKERNLKNQK